MNLQNGYKLIYEKAAGGKRTFFASKCDGSTDKELASFIDSNYRGKVIYEYKGSFYISAGATPKYDENGVPAVGEEKLTAFDEVFIKVEPANAQEPAQVNEPGESDGDGDVGDDENLDPEDDPAEA